MIVKIYGLVLTDKIEIDIIEIKKAKKAYNKNKKDKRAQWMMFMDNPEDEEVERIMEENKSIEKAKIEVVKMSYDEKMRKLADLRDKAIRDEKSAYNTGLHKGQREGLERGRELGITEGRKLGKAEGRNLGITEGEQKTKEEIIKKLYETNMPIEQIAEITDMDISEVKKILKLQ